MKARLGFCLCILLSMTALEASGQPPRKSEVFFAQGQAMYYPDDLPRSRLEATQDLVFSGVLQAVSHLLGPAATQSLFGSIQQKILANKDRYVDAYQLASEGLANGLYRVTGQVTVAKDLLTKDLLELGIPVSTSLESTLPDPREDKKALSTMESSVEGSSRSDPSQLQTSPSQVLWVVAENWDGHWSLPAEAEAGYPTSLAASVLRSAIDRGWALRLPVGGSISIDQHGNPEPNQAIHFAREMGVERAFLGRAWLDASAPNGPCIRAELTAFDVKTGEPTGEIHEERPLGEATSDEGILNLTESLWPPLEKGVAGPVPAHKLTPRSETSESLGTWTIVIRAERPQSAWEYVRKKLETRFQSVQTAGFEMGASEIRVLVDGIDGRWLKDALANGTKAQDGRFIQVENYSEEEQSMVVHFEKSTAIQ